MIELIHVKLAMFVSLIMTVAIEIVIEKVVYVFGKRTHHLKIGSFLRVQKFSN